jgi:hypothetical protein
MTVIPHHRITFSGAISSASAPLEIFAWNLRCSNDPTNSTPAALTAQAASLVADYNTHLAPMFSNVQILTGIRVASIDADGRVVKTSGGAYVQGDWSGTAVGGGARASGGQMPLSTALCVSLVTARAGAAGKGRFFLPWPEKYALGGDYRLSQADTTAIATSAKNFIAAVNTRLGNAVTVVGATSSKTGKPATLSTVTGVKVGRVPDTMRSRRSQMIEGFVQASL